MDRILHDARNAERILRITADTLLLVTPDGTCLDIDAHSDLWFLQEDKLLGKNIFELLPEHTREKVMQTYFQVIEEQKSISKNYKLELKEGTYYFKCIMYPYDDMVLCQYRDITARSNVKLQLERANRSLREIQKLAQLGQWSYNTRERVFYYLGHTDILCSDQVQSIAFSRYQELIVDDDKQTFMDWCRKNEEGDNTESIGYRIRRGDEIFYVRLQAYLREKLPDGSYNIQGYIQNVTDIQRRRNDINTLTHAINNAKESIFAARKDGTLIFANRQFLQNHGLAETETLEHLKIYEIVGDLHTLEDWQERCKDVHDGGSANFVAYHPIRHGKKNDVLAFGGTMYNVTSDSGEQSYWSFTHDISERLRYESQIKRLNQIMDITIDSLPAGIVVKDINNDFRYVYRNRESYNRLTCFGDAIGKNDFDYYPLEIAQKKREEDLQVATTGKGMHWTLEGKDRNGNLLILDKRKIKVEGDDVMSPIIISIEWDITPLELMKRELQASKEKAEMSDKLKSAFLANMSHEIRTPLNAIVGFSRIIAESDDAEERKSYYEIVDANNERLLQLINEILDLSKIESGIVEFTMGTVRLQGLCKEIYDAHVFRTPAGVELVYESCEEDIILETDKNRVFQVISNLIGNAFKFTTEGSVSYGYKKEGEKIVFHVRDTGTGIEPEKVGRVFDRFAKLNNHAQGTGLGLSICKTIVERLGGEISVTSEVGKGTTFSFTLPCTGAPVEKVPELDVIAPAPAASPAEEANPGSARKTEAFVSATKNNITILVAEDTDSNYDLLYAILGRSYQLVRAHDGIEAVMMFEEVKPDLILMDIKMPNLDGLEATKIIRELSPDIPIIAQSAYAYEHDQKAAAEAGCTDFLSKPISQAKLKEMIKKWI